MTADHEHSSAIDADLVRAAQKIKVLSHLDWPKSVEADFLSACERGEPRLPDIAYPAVQLADERRRLEAIMARCDRSRPIEAFLFATARSYARGAELIENRGRPRFRRLSELIYGTPQDPVATDHTTTLDAAQRLMSASARFADRFARKAQDFCVMPETVAAVLRQGSAFFHKHDVKVVVDPDLGAKAAAGALRIRIRGGTCFTDEDAPQLLQHELFVHSLTALNGRMQPRLRALGLGAPRTTRTQEGLALFAELITNSIDINRMRRIAARCVGIDLALNGADFIEVFRYFSSTGQSDGESFASAQRIFRGGDVRGGVAFTKDAVYLQGFVRIHAFLRDAILEGNLDYLSYLVAGRLRAEDVPRLAPLFRSGRLEMPVYEPPWLTRRSSLVAFLLHSNFTTELHVGTRFPNLGQEPEESPPG